MIRLELIFSSILLSISCAAILGVSQPAQKGVAERHLARARALESVNNPDAERMYKLAIEAGGGRYPRALREYSWFLRRQLRFSEAAAALEDYLEKTRDNGADDLKELKDLRRAAELQARISNSEKPELEDLVEYVNLVSGYGANQFRDARPYAQKAVTLYPTSSQAYVALAMAMTGAESARRYELLLKAIELDRNNANAHYWLALEYKAGGRSVEAVEEFHKALELSNGQLALAWRDLGELLTLQVKYKEAIEAFQNYLNSSKVPQPEQELIEQKIKALEKAIQRSK